MLIGEENVKRNSSPVKALLVADDDEDVLLYLTRFLEGKGFKVIKTQKSEEVCSLADVYLPDAILLDVMVTWCASG